MLCKWLLYHLIFTTCWAEGTQCAGISFARALDPHYVSHCAVTLTLEQLLVSAVWLPGLWLSIHLPSIPKFMAFWKDQGVRIEYTPAVSPFIIYRYYGS